MLRLQGACDGGILKMLAYLVYFSILRGCKFELCDCKFEKERLDTKSLITVKTTIPKGYWFPRYSHGIQEVLPM